MVEDLELYTGTLQYRGIEFTFAFDKVELRLIPPKEKRHLIEHEWKWKAIGHGAYVPADPIPVDTGYLVGDCNETTHKIVFIPKLGSYLSLYNAVVRIELMAYVICRLDRTSIDRASFSCPEINYIHPVNQAISLILDPSNFNEKGVATLSTQEFDVTTTETQQFTVDGKEVHSFFGITRKVSTKIHEPPLSLKSALIFDFASTDDYAFVLRLWQIARSFIRFLCYRKNIFISQVELSCPAKEGKHENFATMFLLNQNGKIESDTLQKGRYIKQIRIAGHEGQVLSDIASGNLYLRHLPESSQTGRKIDASRFVMITAAFEWEFRKLYPSGIRKSDATITAEKDVSETLKEQISNTSGKRKEILKRLSKQVEADSLKSEIIQVCKDYSSIFGCFGEHLFHLNDLELNYNEMGERLSSQRNNFAHGNLDKEFIGASALDLILLEFVVYTLQLKSYGIEDTEIQRSINELFCRRLAL